MALPPEQIRIKRRRQDEPVEILYLESENHPTKRRFTEFCFQRIQSSFSSTLRFEEPQRRNGGHGSPTIPRVQAHTAQSVPIVQQINGPVNNQPSDDPTSLPLRNPSQEHVQDTDTEDGGPSLTRSSSRLCNPGLRRFHLSRSYSDIRDDQVFSTNKSMSKPRPTLALFEERDRECLSRLGTSKANKTEKLTETSPLDSESEFNLSSALRRKPPGPNFRGVSFESIRSKDYAEAQHDYVGTSQGNRISADEVNQDSALVKEMQEMALKILEADRKTRVDYETTKTQPTITEEASYVHGFVPERDFVYETYLRCPIDEVGSSNGNEGSDAGKYGILVVDEADEDLWNTHAMSDEDTEWDEDDPDSNAEDNPNNDYPEDEFDSNDEHGEGAYRFRHGASDDEQYDLESDDYV